MESKSWWESKTVWAGLVAAVVPILAAVGVGADWLTVERQAEIVTTIGTVVGVLTVVFRKGTTTVIK